MSVLDQQSVSPGSKASDFQPTTRNPQNEVGGNLQTPSNGSNVFNQPGINPQAFPKTNSLQVTNNGKAVVVEGQPHSASFLPLGIGLVVVVAVFAVLLALVKPAKPDEAAEQKTAPSAATKTKPPKSRSKKTTKPKKKTSKKKKPTKR